MPTVSMNDLIQSLAPGDRTKLLSSATTPKKNKVVLIQKQNQPPKDDVNNKNKNKSDENKNDENKKRRPTATSSSQTKTTTTKPTAKATTVSSITTCGGGSRRHSMVTPVSSSMPIKTTTKTIWKPPSSSSNIRHRDPAPSKATTATPTRTKPLCLGVDTLAPVVTTKSTETTTTEPWITPTAEATTAAAKTASFTKDKKLSFDFTTTPPLATNSRIPLRKQSSSYSSSRTTQLARSSTKSAPPPLSKSTYKQNALPAKKRNSTHKRRSPAVAATTTPSSSITPLRFARVAGQLLQNDNDMSPLTRRNLDKRTARIKYRDEFMALIQDYIQANNHQHTLYNNQNNNNSSGPTKQTTKCGISVVVRKRPLFPEEKALGDFDVIRVLPTEATTERAASVAPPTTTTTYDNAECQPQRKTHPALSSTLLSVFRTQLKSDMTSPERLDCSTFSFTRVYDESTSSDTVYETSVQPMLHNYFFKDDYNDNDDKTSQHQAPSTSATILLFGQTGTGKTYTATALEHRASRDLFRSHSQEAVAAPRVMLEFVELVGETCLDLLRDNDKDDSNHKVTILGGGGGGTGNKSGGTVEFKNATCAVAQSSDHLIDLIQQAKSRRFTEHTDRNTAGSSRSHAICRISVWKNNQQQQQNDTNNKPFVLTIVDCAGTERRNDSLFHSPQRQAESAEINASMFALKQCIRARFAAVSSLSPSPTTTTESKSSSSFVNYRASLLTKILRDSLEPHSTTPLLVIATVAPNATDTEHTLDTLQTVQSIMTMVQHDHHQHQELVKQPEAADKNASPKTTTITTTQGRGKCQQQQTKTGVSSLSSSSSCRPSSNKQDQNVVAPKKWNHEQLVQFLKQNQLVPKKSLENLPASLDGKQVMLMNEIKLKLTFFSNTTSGGTSNNNKNNNNNNTAGPSSTAIKVKRLHESLRLETRRIDELERKQRMEQLS